MEQCAGCSETPPEPGRRYRLEQRLLGFLEWLTRKLP